MNDPLPNPPNPPIPQPPSPLETQLAHLSEWAGDPPRPAPWERALAETAAAPAHLLHPPATRPATHSGRFSARLRRHRPALAAAAVLLVGLSLFLVLSPSLSSSSPPPRQLAAESRRKAESPSTAADLAASAQNQTLRELDTMAPSASVVPPLADARSRSESSDRVGRSLPASPSSAGLADTSQPRLVARTATIDLAVPDTRAAFAKARAVVNDASGEFVQESSLTEPPTGGPASATLTLRVRADRLSDALNTLRDLGRVLKEDGRADDVTDQAVDLDARLASEKRVETELGDLLKRRSDDKLREVLELRQRLGEVRTSIERLTAQRDRLARLASLATVVVSLRAESDKPEHQSLTFWTDAQDRFTRALNDGLTDLTDSAAALLRFVLASALPLAILGAISLGVFRAARRGLSTSAPSAPPRTGSTAPAP